MLPHDAPGGLPSRGQLIAVLAAVTVTAIGFMGYLPGAMTGEPVALVAAWGLWCPSRRSTVRAVEEGPRHRLAGRPGCFSASPTRRSVGEAGSRNARGGKSSLAARNESSERPAAEPTKRRRLTKPGKGQTAVRV